MNMLRYRHAQDRRLLTHQPQADRLVDGQAPYAARLLRGAAGGEIDDIGFLGRWLGTSHTPTMCS